MKYWEYMRKADQTNQVLSDIPKATLLSIKLDTEHYGFGIENPKDIRAVVVENKIVSTVSKQYKLVQHEEAFKPIFDGLHSTGTDYEFALFETDTKAFLKVFVGDIPDNGKAIKLGFEAKNSIDGRNSISYGMTSSIVSRETTIELVGYRQVCKNGMKIRVPLAEAKELRIEKQVVDKVTKLLSMATRIVHMGEVKKKVEAVQYVVEAMTLLKEPVALMIAKAKKKELGEKQAKELIAKYIGKRLNDKIIGQYKNEEPSLWGLYNAITWVASNGGVKIPTMNGLIEKSAKLLEKEVFVK